jgi:hypothetical protein
MAVGETASASVAGPVSGMRLVAVAFSVLAAAILGIRAFFTATQLDGPGWAVVCALAALSNVAAAVAVARGSAWALPGVALAVVLAAVVEVVPVAPPRLVSLLAALVAGAAAVASARENDAPASRASWQTVLGWVAFGLYLPIGLLYLISGLVVPVYGGTLLLAAWALLLIVLFRLLATRPAWALLIPALAVALWVGVLAFGGSVLDWTA